MTDSGAITSSEADLPVSIHPWQLSYRARVSLLMGVVLLYVLAYDWLLPLMGSSVAVLSFIPVALANLLFGLGPGLIASVLLILLNLALFFLSGETDLEGMLWHGGAAGYFALVSGGAILGRMHDLGLSLVRELERRRRVEAALRLSEERACLHSAQAHRQAQELAMLEQVRLALTCDIDLPIILHKVVESVAGALGYQRVSLYLLEGDALVRQAQVGCEHSPDRIPAASGIPGRVASTGAPALVDDARADSDYKADAPACVAPDVVSELCVPLFANGRVAGVLDVQSAEADRLGTGDLRLLSMLGESVGFAIERARLYAGLHDSEERFRKSFEDGPLGMAILGPELRFLQVNNTLCQMTGYSEDALTGLSILDLTHPDDMSASLHMGRQLIDGEVPSYQLEKRYIKKDGSVLWISLTASALRDDAGRFLYGLVMVEDISQRKRVERAEREQRALTEALHDSAGLINSTLQFDQVLDRILANAGRVVPHDAAAVLLVEDGAARVEDCHGYTEEQEQALRAQTLPLDQTPLLRWMVETGQPLAIADTRTDRRWAVIPGMETALSYAGAPVRVKGQTVGFIHLESAVPGFFTSTHAARLQVFAEQAGAAIENARLFRNVQRFSRQMALLNDITRAAISAPDLPKMLQLLADRLGELIDADSAFICLWDEAREAPILAASSWGLGESYLGLDSAHEALLSVCSIEPGQALVVEDVFASPVIDPRLAALLPVQSLLGAPMVVDDQRLGSALIGFHQRHLFAPDETSLIQQAAAQIALAISKVNALEAERQRTDQLRRANSFLFALSQVAARIESAPDPDGVMETLGAELEKQGNHCLVALPTPEGLLAVRYITISAAARPEGERLLGSPVDQFQFAPERFPYYTDVMIGRQARHTPDPLPVAAAIFPDVPEAELRQSMDLIGITPRSRAIFLPMAAGEQVLGMLWMWGECLEESDLPAALVFASQVAVALENARLYACAQQLAITDELTGLYNRRGLFELGRREVERAARFDRCLAALMLDIDYFKQVNDRFGHAAGDQVLQALAERCRGILREIDLFGRYGGEEFVILLPESDLDAALHVAERLRQAIMEMVIATTHGPVQVTVSLGVTTLDDIPSLAALIERCDQAMYQAKQAGRNRVGVQR